MTKNQIAIESMASDLKRVTLGLQRGSLAMSERFLQESKQRKKEIKFSYIPKYIVDIIRKVGSLNIDNNIDNNKEHIAEDCLMYSTLLQNHARHKIYQRKFGSS